MNKKFRSAVALIVMMLVAAPFIAKANNVKQDDKFVPKTLDKQVEKQLYIHI